MVLISLSIGTFNIIKFFVIEILITLFLEPVWELFVARSAHSRVYRGHRVHLKTFWKWRSWPCQVSLGPWTKVLAIILSLTTIIAAILAEYSVDSAAITTEDTSQSRIYSRRLGPPKNSDISELAAIVERVTNMADACIFKADGKYYVNSTFVDGGDCVANNDSDETHLISDTCVVTKTEAETSNCLYDLINGDFVVSGNPGGIQSNDSNLNFLTEAFQMINPSIYSCGIGDCTLERQGTDPATLFQLKRSETSDAQSFAFYVSEEWRAITQFEIGDVVYPSMGEVPVFVYRKTETKNADFQPGNMEVSMRVVDYFSEAFAGGLTYSSFKINRKREGVIMMLLLEGFGRKEDIKMIRDYRKDKISIKTDIKLAFLAPLAVLCVSSILLLLVSLVLRYREQKWFTVPVNLHDMMRCARAREESDKYHAFGYPEKGLVLGIVEGPNEVQRFSVSASNAVLLEPDQWESQEKT